DVDLNFVGSARPVIRQTKIAVDARLAGFRCVVDSLEGFVLRTADADSLPDKPNERAGLSLIEFRDAVNHAIASGETRGDIRRRGRIVLRHVDSIDDQVASSSCWC